MEDRQAQSDLTSPTAVLAPCWTPPYDQAGKVLGSVSYIRTLWSFSSFKASGLNIDPVNVRKDLGQALLSMYTHTRQSLYAPG